ncbi:hypothetical protein DM02DRAFT_360654 [Periconia macrospinosa]|uniref:Uncharacterized protein n=1 Tax=Periconia macrospinosa TaxID=97972 RepID=A0A2V1CZV3_9PLEO|nr:hypothetical protein DM02DRAFT_360654 [Periconia macrospinosa]
MTRRRYSHRAVLQAGTAWNKALARTSGERRQDEPAGGRCSNFSLQSLGPERSHLPLQYIQILRQLSRSSAEDDASSPDDHEPRIPLNYPTLYATAQRMTSDGYHRIAVAIKKIHSLLAVPCRR